MTWQVPNNLPRIKRRARLQTQCISKKWLQGTVESKRRGFLENCGRITSKTGHGCDGLSIDDLLVSTGPISEG